MVMKDFHRKAYREEDGKKIHKVERVTKSFTTLTEQLFFLFWSLKMSIFSSFLLKEQNSFLLFVFFGRHRVCFTHDVTSHSKNVISDIVAICLNVGLVFLND